MNITSIVVMKEFVYSSFAMGRFGDSGFINSKPNQEDSPHPPRFDHNSFTLLYQFFGGNKCRPNKFV